MPSESFYHTLLKLQGIEYAVGDAERRVVEYSPGLVRWAHLVSGPVRGRKLEDVFVEFVGSELELARVQRGETPSFKVEHSARTLSDGKTAYLTLMLVRLPPGVLLLATDATSIGQLEQRVTQQRNDLDLLAGELVSARARLDDLLHRFIPGAVADQMLADPQATHRGGKRREVTLLFADLRGFTHWAEAQAPETVLAFLNQQMTLGIDMILAEGGTLDKIMGDALMVVFNAPHDQPDHALRAVRAARALRAVIPTTALLQFGIGIHTGLVVAGHIGSERAMNYTVIGAAVNQAKGLEEMAQPGQILISETTHALIARHMPTRALGPRALRGRGQIIEVFEVLA